MKEGNEPHGMGLNINVNYQMIGVDKLDDHAMHPFGFVSYSYNNFQLIV